MTATTTQTAPVNGTTAPANVAQMLQQLTAGEAALAGQVHRAADLLANVGHDSLPLALARLKAEAEAARDRLLCARGTLAAELSGVLGLMDGLTADLAGGFADDATDGLSLPAPLPADGTQAEQTVGDEEQPQDAIPDAIPDDGTQDDGEPHTVALPAADTSSADEDAEGTDADDVDADAADEGEHVSIAANPPAEPNDRVKAMLDALRAQPNLSNRALCRLHGGGNADARHARHLYGAEQGD